MSNSGISHRNALIWVACGLLSTGSSGIAQEPAAAADQDIPDAIVKKVDPSVVAIKHENAIGSGFIISPDGYILSNGHVVRGEDEENPLEPAKSVTVILNDERKFPARVIGFCMNPDVSVLKIECDTPLIPVEFGDSRRVSIGQKVFAVGTPLGLKRTFSGGILSNIDRTDLGTFTKVLQTDAAINPGNSGGPLFDREGRVLGLNTYGNAGANNLGFTIPIHVADEVRKDIMKQGRFIRADLPVISASEMYKELRTALGVEGGILIEYVMENTPAYQAGLRSGDILVKQDGKPVSASTEVELKDWEWAMTIREPGSTISWTALRKDGDRYREVTVEAKLEESEPIPATRQFPGEIKTEKIDALGLSFQEITRIQRLAYRLQDDPGVLVKSADSGTPAEKAGLKGGDIITQVEGKQVSDVSSFRQALESCLLKQEKYITLTLKRQKLTLRTALAPYYDLKGMKVAVVVPPGEARYLETVLRELVAQGASLTLASPKGDVTCPTVAVQAKSKISDIQVADLLLVLDGVGAKDYWNDKIVAALVRGIHRKDGMLAAIGTSAITVVAAEPKLADKKMTTSKEDSSEAIQRKFQYTGEAVEKDGGLITTEGKDRKTVREFLKEVAKAAGARSRK